MGASTISLWLAVCVSSLSATTFGYGESYIPDVDYSVTTPILIPNFFFPVLARHCM